MSDVVDPIFPKRWVPPFLREQYTQEEVEQIRIRVAGHYKEYALDNTEFRFQDKRGQKWFRVKFFEGVIYLIEEGKDGDRDSG